jgi:hypothetical protein
MIRRIVAMSLALTFVSFAAVQADEPGGEDIVVPPPAAVVEEDPVTGADAGPDYARNGFYVGLGANLGINTFKDDAEDNITDQLAALGYVDLGFRDAEPPDGTGEVEWVDFSNVQAKLHVDVSMGVNGRVGYRFHPNLSAELQAEWQNGFDTDIGVSGLTIKRLTPEEDDELEYSKFATVEIEPWVITGNVKGHLLTGLFQPFLLVGVGVMTAEVKTKDFVGLGLSNTDRLTGFAARFGGGIELYANEHIVFALGTDYVFPTGDVEDLDHVSISFGIQYRF